MRTRTVRIYERDVDGIRELTGLGAAGLFAIAAQLVVDQASKHGPAGGRRTRRDHTDLEECSGTVGLMARAGNARALRRLYLSFQVIIERGEALLRGVDYA